MSLLNKDEVSTFISKKRVYKNLESGLSIVSISYFCLYSGLCSPRMPSERLLISLQHFYVRITTYREESFTLLKTGNSLTSRQNSRRTVIGKNLERSQPIRSSFSVCSRAPIPLISLLIYVLAFLDSSFGCFCSSL